MSAYRRNRHRARRLAALGAAAVLSAGTVGACQAAREARAEPGGPAGATAERVADAVDELLAWEGVTAEATIDASPEQVRTYLTRTTPDGRPAEGAARRLAELETTLTVGSPEDKAVMRDVEADEPLDGAMTVTFGGDDVAGAKIVGGTHLVKADAAAVARDVRHGDEAAVAAAQRLVRDARQLPDYLAAPREVLQGRWVPVDPYRYDDYARVLGTKGAAGDLGDALTDAGTLLTDDAMRAFADGLDETVGGGSREVTFRAAGQERGADLVQARLPAGEAWRLLEPVLGLLAADDERFGLPRVVGEPATERLARQEVSAELVIRNGVLSGLTLDLAQFGTITDAGGPLPPLPLSVTLTGGTALSLAGAGVAELTPTDLELALVYLERQAERHQQTPGRAELPGPMQPGA